MKPLLALALCLAACGGNSKPTEDRIAALESRVKELEVTVLDLHKTRLDPKDVQCGMFLDCVVIGRQLGVMLNPALIREMRK